MKCSKDDSADCCGLCDYTPVVVIATHERKELTTKNINELLLMTPKPKIVIVCSSQDELEYYKELGVNVVHYPNRPLGAKWQSGVNAAAKLGANPLIILGSDDFINNDYLKFALQKLNEGFDFIGLTHWMMDDVIGREKYHCQYTNLNVDFPIGSGRVYSKSILEGIRWKVFNSSLDKHLDDQGFKNVKNRNAKIFLHRSPEVLAIKTGKEMNTVEAYKRSRNITCKRIK